MGKQGNTITFDVADDVEFDQVTGNIPDPGHGYQITKDDTTVTIECASPSERATVVEHLKDRGFKVN